MKPFLRIKSWSDEDQKLMQKLLNAHPSLHDGNGIITCEEVQNIFDWDGDRVITQDDFNQFDHRLRIEKEVSKDN